MSELSKPTHSIDDSMARLENLVRHMKEHVSDVPVRTKKFDHSCEGCRMELERIGKKSDNSLGVQLKGEPLAIVSYTTVLCYLQMHDECAQNYVMESEMVKFRCTCECHDKPTKSAYKRHHALKRPSPAVSS